MRHVQFVFESSIGNDKALEAATATGIAHPYLLEETSPPRIIVGGFSEKSIEPPSEATLLLDEPAAIDWSAQWAAFSPYPVENGEISFSLSDFDGPDLSISLLPGGGFGDLSHPTTRLMLRLMASTPLEKTIVDVGCGSGILTLAATRLSSTSSILGIDIDPVALEHARENLDRNASSSEISLILPTPLSLANATILLNMTLQEQKQAVSAIQTENCTWIISGIHTENLSAFFQFLESKSLVVERVLSEEEWHAFVAHEKRPLTDETTTELAEKS